MSIVNPEPKEAAQQYVAGLDCLARILPASDGQHLVLEEIRFSQALIRNYYLRYWTGNLSDAWHVAVVGGGGAGKSTVVNILLGQPLAEANPQSGYTRHPTAFCLNVSLVTNALPQLRCVLQPVPGNIDEDIFDVRSVKGSIDLPPSLVIWDNPDMTTIHAGNYIARLLEVLGLADILIYVASVQRYNDRVPSEYLRMLAASGKPVIACLTKVPESESDLIRRHFSEEVLKNLPRSGTIPCIIVPEKSLAELHDPLSMADVRQQLLGHIHDLVSRGLDTRRQIITRGLEYLQQCESHWSQLASPLLRNLVEWRQCLSDQRNLVLNRYRREFLEQERLLIFDEAMVRLLELLEVPGIGSYLSTALNILRLPWRGVKMLWQSLTGSGNVSPALQSERSVILQAIDMALTGLWHKAEQRSQQDPAWKRLSEHLSVASAFRQQIRHDAEKLLSDYEQARRDCVESIACAIYRDLQASPVILNTLRATKLTVELGSIGGILLTGGLSIWDVVWLPLAASLVQALTEYLGQQYVETRRAEARNAQLAILERSLLEPLWRQLGSCQPTQDWWELEQTLSKLPLLREKFSRGIYENLKAS